MSFAFPLALCFLGLFLPVILLYLLKQRRRRVQVSTLLFWDRILRDEQTVTSITKLKKLLSLLLQLLFIALLTFALAQPLLSDRLTGARRIVLFLDTSASMSVQEGDKTRFDQAKDQAARVIRGMGIGDTLMLISVSSGTEIVHPFTDSKKELQEALRHLTPSHGATDFRGALRLLDLLPAEERETYVYIVSDGAFDPVPVAPPPKTQFAYLKIGEARDNIGISAFQVRPLPASPRDFQIFLELTNQTEKERLVPVELHIEGQLVDAYEFTLPSGGTTTHTLRQFSAQGGAVEVVLDVEDSFALDNRAHATLPAPSPIQVLLVSEANLFLENALLTDDGVALDVSAPAGYPGTNAHEVTIFSGWAPAQTPPGNSIFISAWPADLGLTRTGMVEKPLFTDWNREHPVNRFLALKNVTIEKAAGISSHAGFEVLAGSFEHPLVLLREQPDRKTMVVTFDTLSTDLPLRVAFPIMVANAIRYLAGAGPDDRWQNVAIGQILSAAELQRYTPRSSPGAAEPILAVLDPSGARFEASSEGGLVPVSRIGLYEGEALDGSRFPIFAANLASLGESRIKPSEDLPLRSDKPLPQIQDGFRLGFEPWWLLILLAFLLSTTEWGLFHRRVIE